MTWPSSPRELDGWVEITMPVGGYVGARHHDRDRAHPWRRCRRTSSRACLLLASERTLLQDPGFGFRQLVDIASKALSPSINDPTTAVQVVDRVTELLGRDRRPSGSERLVRRQRGRRHACECPVDTFDELVTLAYAEIIRYGVDSPQIVRRLHAAFDHLDERCGRLPHTRAW